MSTLPSTTLAVDPDWIDAYGHMNAAHYVGVFDRVDLSCCGRSASAWTIPKPPAAASIR